MTSDLQQMLKNVYSSPETDIGHQIDAFKNVYNLPDLSFEWNADSAHPGADEGFFKYASKVDYFVVLALYFSYDYRKKRLFLIHSADANKAEASLPGGAIDQGETIQETVQRMARRCHPDVRLGEVEPIAVLTHKFRFGDDVHIQTGLAYIARVINHDEIRQQAQPFVKLDSIKIEQISRYSNRQVCELVIARLERKTKSHGSDIEIDAQQQHLRRYQIHQRYVKPCFDLLKRSRAVRERLLRAIGSAQLILDASCGDCDTLIDLAETQKRFCVGNDVAWSQVVSLLDRLKRKPADLRFRMLFTNHNITDLPFVERFFNVTLCKNTLHHFRGKEEFEEAMASMARVSKRLVIIDIEDPLTSGLGPRAINAYYQHVLGDVGDKFLRFDQFEGILTTWTRVHGGKCSIERLKSIWGNWMFAVIDLVERPAAASL